MNYIPLKGIEIVHLFEYSISTLGEQLPIRDGKCPQ